MSKTFKIPKIPYEKEQMFQKTQVTFNPGISVLIGCNGSGKSTLLSLIKNQLNNKEIPYLSYDNLSQGGFNAKEKALGYCNFELANVLMSSSEGEQIFINFGQMVTSLRQFVTENKDAKEIWILFDAIDSGLSIDNIVEIKAFINNKLIKENQHMDVYVLISANSYEMCRNSQCFDVRNCKYRLIRTYHEFSKFILKSRELKDIRIKDAYETN